MTVTDAQTTTVAARADDVWKVYGSGEAQVAALRGVSVELRRAEFTAIMGPSGSGKSTLMHCLAGLDTVTRGDVFVGGTKSDRHVRLGADQAAPRTGRLHLPAVQPAAHADGRGEHHAAARDRRPQARQGVVRPRHRHRRPARPAQPPAHPAVRRPAAARGVRPGARVAAGGHLRRRTDRQPRLPLRCRGAGLPAQLGQRVRSDHRHGHPRPERRRVRRPGDLPRRRRDRHRTRLADRRRGARHHEASRRDRGAGGA